MHVKGQKLHTDERAGERENKMDIERTQFNKE